jgi:hypothetical protein
MEIFVPPDREAALTQFSRLMEELLSGKTQRTKFQAWEIDFLLDAINCDLSRFASAAAVLRQYEEAARSQIAELALLPMKLSVFLATECVALEKMQRAGKRRTFRANDRLANRGEMVRAASSVG